MGLTPFCTGQALFTLPLSLCNCNHVSATISKLSSVRSNVAAATFAFVDFLENPALARQENRFVDLSTFLQFPRFMKTLVFNAFNNALLPAI